MHSHNLIQSMLSTWAQQPVLLGAWFGLLHALDADHVTTIGGLAINDRSTSATGYAVRWALGHAVSLGLIAVLVLGLGLWGVTALASYAEAIVAVSLVVIGYHTLRTAVRHDVAAAGATAPRPGASRARTGVLMGLLHGGAGSAAVIALIPLASFESSVNSGLYLAAFSVGVGIGACGFSGLLVRCFAITDGSSRKVRVALRCIVGVLAIATGALLFIETSHGGG